MNYTTLAVKSAFRNRLRSSLTAVGVAIAVIAFLFLRTIIASFSAGVDNASQDRLVTRNKISVTFAMPLAYKEKIQSVPGVAKLTWANWFGGVYKDPKNFFPRFAIDPQSYLEVYPEFVLSDDEKKAFFGDRTGAVVGERLAEKYGFKVGDVIHMAGDIYPGDWDFNVRGIYHGRDRGTDTGLMFIQWKYVDERVVEGRKNQAGTFLFRVDDPRRSVQVARAVDELFSNSLAETRTESEKAFQLSFFSMISALVDAINVISLVMLLILVLILANTMAMSTRERTSEYAMMRSVGFKPFHIIGLVLAEAVVVGTAGFAIGAVLAAPLIQAFNDWGQKQFGNFLRGGGVAASAVEFAFVATLVGGLLATGIPAWRAGRLRIVDALRRIE